MTDPTQPGFNDDPLEVNNIIAEAAAVQEDVQSIEAMAQSFENDTAHYTETFTEECDESLKAFQAEIEAWQTETAKVQAAMTEKLMPSTPNTPASATHITQDQLEALKQRLGGSGKTSPSTASARATKKSPTPDA